MPDEIRWQLTDSPWFWVLIFFGMALAALLAIGPKYGGRQARIERQYQARERMVAERASENSGHSLPRIEGQAEHREFASPEDTLVPLWPLAMVLSLVMIFSIVMLVRSKKRTALHSQGKPP